MNTKNQDFTLASVAAILSQDYAVSIEYPGYINIAIAPSINWHVGTANGPWEIDVACGGSIHPLGVCFTPTASTEPREIAQWVMDQAKERGL